MLVNVRFIVLRYSLSSSNLTYSEAFSIVTQTTAAAFIRLNDALGRVRASQSRVLRAPANRREAPTNRTASLPPRMHELFT